MKPPLTPTLSPRRGEGVFAAIGFSLHRTWAVKLLHEVLGPVLSAPVLGELLSQAFEETEG